MILRIDVPDDIAYAIIREAGPDALNERVVNALRAMSHADAKDPVFSLHQRGLSDAEIGIQLGLDASAVKYRRSKLGLPANRRHAHKPESRKAA